MLNFFKNISVLARFLSLLTAFILLLTSSAAALTPDQIRSLQSGARYFNTEVCDNGQAAAPTSSTTGPVFVIGDSISVGLKNAGLERKLVEKQLTPATIDATSGISLGFSISHLDDANTQTFIRTASVAVVELGTNPGSEVPNFADQVNEMVSKFKAINPSIKLFWVNIGSKSHPTIYANRNNILNQIAPNNFTVIDWTNQNIPLEPDNVHPTADGYNKLGDFIVGSVAGNSIPASADTPEVCCAEGGTLLSGSDNKIKIWNFLITKGLTAPQTAGVMGNLQAESHFDPAIEQTPGAWGDMSGASNHAVGIAQWDGGRRPALINAAAAQGKDPKDLAFQLEYLFNEASGRQVDNTLGKTPPAALGAPNEWEGLRLMQNARDATIFWHAEFEVSADNEQRVQGRVDLAEAILAELGSTTAATSAGFGSDPSGCAPSGSGGAQQIVDTALKLSWPERQGLTPKPEYVAAVQQYNPSAPYGGADCGAFVGIVMRMSGADPEYAIQQTKNQENYVRAHPEKFDVAENVKPGDLLPGDVLIVNQGSGQGSDGHTFIYVGPQAPSGYTQASASGGKRMPNLGGLPTVGEFVAEPAISNLNYIRVRLK